MLTGHFSGVGPVSPVPTPASHVGSFSSGRATMCGCHGIIAYVCLTAVALHTTTSALIVRVTAANCSPHTLENRQQGHSHYMRPYRDMYRNATIIAEQRERSERSEANNRVHEYVRDKSVQPRIRTVNHILQK